MACSQGVHLNATIFDQVQARFLSSLPPHHQLRVKSCSSADVFISQISRMDVVSQNGPRRGRFLSRLNKLINNLKPFLRVIDIVVSSHPEYAAIVWGGINLAMQLAGNYASFFEKLSKTLERFSKQFPAYEEVERITKARGIAFSDQVQQSLGRVYESLLLFIQSVIDVFSKPDGRPRAKAMIVGALAFKSFDLRFEDILSELTDDQKLLELEMQVMSLSLTDENGIQASQELETAQKAVEIHAKQIEEKMTENLSLTAEIKATTEKTYKEMTLQKIRGWLHAPSFASDYEDSRQQRERDTCNWIFNDKKYQTWCASSSEQVRQTNEELSELALWIHGSPGAGKTVLAATIIDDLLDQWSNPHMRTPVLYYFFRETSQWTDPCDAYRAMLGQILHTYRQDTFLADKFSFACSDASSGQTTATQSELIDLLKLCLDYFDNIFIVLDGVDECSDPESLLRDLDDVGCGHRYKILFVSRLNVSQLLRVMPGDQRITMSNSSVVGDIRLYARRKLEIMLKQNQFPRSATLEYLTEQIVKGSGHMFLWTRLMVSYLKSPALLPKQRLKTASDISLPEGLDAMYSRILILISQCAKPEIRLAMTVLSWLAGARHELLENEVKEAMRVEMDCDEDDDFEDFCHSVVVTCCGLVEPSSSFHHDSTTGVYLQFTHLSARDYFFRLTSSDVPVPPKLQPYILTRSQIDQKIASNCLNYIAKNLAHPLSGDMTKSADLLNLRSRHPLAVYSCSMWIEHLTSAVCPHSTETSKSNVLLALEGMLSRPLAVMSWLEGSYSCQSWLNRGQSHDQSVRKLSEWCDEALTRVNGSADKSLIHIISWCKDLCADLFMLHQHMGAALIHSPRSIWDEVPAFAPSQFWVASSSTAFNVLSPEIDCSDKDLSAQSLVTVSASFLSRSLIGILSIWPSRKFNNYWSTVRDEINLRDLHCHCGDWVAQYEVKSVAEDEPKTMYKMTVPLPAKEVWTAIHQSLRKEAAGNWRFHFPVSIREDLQAFVVLQTLHTASISESNAVAKVRSTNLDLEDTLGLKPTWWELKSIPPLASHKVQRGGPNDLGTYYTYKLTFSPDGRLLYFRDYHQFQQSTLAILSVAESGSVSFLSKCESPASWDEDVVCFHPQAPVTFIFRNRVVCVWKYSTNEPVLGMWQPNCGYQDGLKEMSVSNCGQYLVMKFPGRSPVIQNITNFLGSNFCPPSSAVAVQTSPTSMTKTLLQPTQVIKGLDLDISKGGSYRSLSIQKDQTGIDVHEWTGEDRREMMEKQQLIEQRLTMIPEWSSLQANQISVRWPAADEQRVKIVVDQPAQKHYSHATSQNPISGPFLIQRDIRVLEAPAPKSDLQITGLPPKRRKIDAIIPSKIRKRLSVRTMTDVKKHAGWS